MLIPRGQGPAHAPFPQHRSKLVRNKETGAFLIVRFPQQIVVIREGVTRVGDKREPSGRLRRGDPQSGAVNSVVQHRLEFM